MNVLVCPMCDWRALVAGGLSGDDFRHVARRILNMHFDVHVAELDEELDEVC